MCTVTVVPTPEGFRLMCNRDERHTRPAAVPPRVRKLFDRTVVFPLDPPGGGTWIGANDTGIALALLNATPSEPASESIMPTRFRSRGLLIPSLLDATDLAAIETRVARVDPAIYQRFRLVAVQMRRGFVFASDSQRISSTPFRLSRPTLFTSSSLGDVRAAMVREPLFESMVVGAPDSWLAGQMRFHDYQFIGNTAFDIRMKRADARTVSRSVVEIDSTAVRMEYEPLGEKRSR